MVVIDKRNNSFKPLISIVTATYNAAAHLQGLIASIKAQTDRDFEWVVADGSSSDDTLDILKRIEGVSMLVDSQPDYGIYDAFNRAIKLARGDYYLVVGADDRLSSDAIFLFKRCVEESNVPDLVIGKVQIGNHERRSFWNPNMGWLGAHNVVTAHSVGMLIKKNLHELYGYYSLEYIQCADAYFIKIILKYDLKVVLCDALVGNFFLGGVSNIEVNKGLYENFIIQLRTEKSKSLQVLIYILRLIKNIGKFT